MVVLHTPLLDPARLEPFVEDCLRTGIRLIAVFGEDAAAIEDVIDDIVVGDGSRDDRFIVTSCHIDEPIEEVMSFAASWDGGSTVSEVRF